MKYVYASEEVPYGQDPERVVHLSVEHLHGPEEVAYEADELVVVCLVRDGRPYVNSYVEHYASMGVKHIFFLDNGSTDGTVATLKDYENVTVLRTGLPYKNPKGGRGGTESLFKQYLVDRFGKEGRWCLCADIDELFDYPYSDVVSLSTLLGYLSSNSYTAVVAQMLDMFPEEPLSGSREGSLPDEPLKERHRFYDVSNVRTENIKELRRLRNNILESDDIEFFSGGIRSTIFRTTSLLTKFPLVFSDGRVKTFDGSAHWVDNARIADLTCVLFHYKFLDEHFHKQAARAVREGQYYNNSALYKKYLQVLEGNTDLRVKQETAREIGSVDELVENGFLVVSEDYMELVYEQEERKKGAGRGDLRGEPGGGPGEEAALRRARARAEVQGLRARRLERRLEELREQNRREVQKLTSTLARVRKKNRNLADQLRSMRASRSWRLLNKLGGVRARVRPGRKR
jgi:glycosyl transferase family 2